MSAGLTVGAVIANAARAAPAQTAAVIDGSSHSFAALNEAGDRAAARLIGAGGERGDVLLALAETSFAQLALFVGAARSGMVFAPLNPRLDPTTIAALVTGLNPRLVVADPHHAHLVEHATSPVLTTSGADDSQPPPTSMPAVRPVDGHVAFFTSGSTGLPKAALLSHETSVLRSHPGSQLEPRGPALCPYPLFHMAGWTISMQQWHARAAVVFVDGTEPTMLADALQRHQIERFNAIPALWARLAEHLGPAGVGAFPELKFADTGTSPTSVDLLKTIGRLAPNATVRVFYGSTETGNTSSLHHEDLTRKPGSCGLPGPLTEVRLDDSGELLVRGPLLFDGYLGDTADGRGDTAPSRPDADGWYGTGDLATIDDDGYIHIVGRVDTEIRTGGEAVSPDRVEAALRTHPEIDAVAVFGVADPQWGEIVWAAVVSERPLTLSELRGHLGPDGPDPLAPHQHPRALLLLDEIPTTAATGKTDRQVLRALAREAGE